MIAIVRKFGYIIVARNENTNGMDLALDISADTSIHKIKTVFDIGASVGRMSLLFHNIFPQAAIHAFEPSGQSFEQLQKVARGRARIKPVHKAMSSAPGEADLFIQKNHGFNSLKEGNNNPDPVNGNISERISITTIDIYCAENGIDYIDFIKSDTEGLDVEVLKGADRMLREKKIKYIYVEATFDKSNKQNTLFDELRDHLANYGFKVRGVYDQSTYGNKSYLTCVNVMFASVG